MVSKPTPPLFFLLGTSSFARGQRTDAGAGDFLLCDLYGRRRSRSRAPSRRSGTRRWPSSWSPSASCSPHHSSCTSPSPFLRIGGLESVWSRTRLLNWHIRLCFRIGDPMCCFVVSLDPYLVASWRLLGLGLGINLVNIYGFRW
jgi:hypothetical protein